jgi:hypothetical protein
LSLQDCASTWWGRRRLVRGRRRCDNFCAVVALDDSHCFDTPFSLAIRTSVVSGFQGLVLAITGDHSFVQTIHSPEILIWSWAAEFVVDGCLVARSMLVDKGLVDTLLRLLHWASSLLHVCNTHAWRGGAKVDTLLDHPRHFAQNSLLLVLLRLLKTQEHCHLEQQAEKQQHVP